jgi:hypothetical protein
MKKHAISGFIAFFLMEVAGITYAYVLGHLTESNSSLLVIGLILGVGVGLIGALFGLFYCKYLADMPSRYEYLNAPFWIIVCDISLRAWKGGFAAVMSEEVAIASIFYVLTGLVFIRLTRLNYWKSNRKAPDEVDILPGL